MKVLVTGSHGFVGSHFLGVYGGVGLSEDGTKVDIRDPKAVERRVSEVQPEAVLHLAAQTFVPSSFEDPFLTYQVNFFGTFNLLAALKKTGFRGRMLFVGSAESYGQVDASRLPILEETPLRPRNPYAVSKVAAEALCFEAGLNYGFDIVIARPFNQFGPGQDERFVISNFAKQAVEVRLGKRPPEIEVGDLESSRDFTDVRDTVRAYRLLLHQGQNGEAYNVCSGNERKIGDLLKKLLKIEGVDPKITQVPVRMRASEQCRAVGSSEKLQRQTGWLPEIELEQSLRDILTFWKARLA
ncbi:MAG: GDP-mannose 4,6-dehydratase [bacterium]